MDDLILASDDDGNNDDDDDKDGEAQLHIDVGGCSQFPDENIPKTFWLLKSSWACPWEIT